MKIYNDITELIGKTPLLRLHALNNQAQLFAKCEFMNPMSLKDRTVLNIINEAEQQGLLKSGGTLIESTSGNTGMAIAFIAAIRGYKCILCMSEIQSVERRQVMRAFGAQLVLTPAGLGTAGARAKMLELIAANPDYFYVGQHVNPDNPAAHYKTTGPEIWSDLDGQVDIFVAGLGTGGTVCGTSQYLKEKNPRVQIVAVEPEDAPYISKGEWQPHRVMGLAPGFVPEVLSKQDIDEYILVSEQDAFAMTRRLAATNGVLVGISAGAVAVAMDRLASITANKGKRIVGIFADSGQRYLSVDGLFGV